MTEILDLQLANPKLPVPRVYRAPAGGGKAGVGDAAGLFTYVFTKELGLAINAALAARRPLLLLGAPGSGKSTLARAVAGIAGRAFLKKVITSDTKLDDLLTTYDYVRRLQDASDPKRGLAPDYEYVEPQALFWALAPHAALGRGMAGRMPVRTVAPPAGVPSVTTAPAVLLLDEIDKADPSLPNDLLVTLGEGRFRIRETGEEVVAEEGRDPFIVVTTNEERELSRAFIRRCLVAELPVLAGDALREWLITVGGAHFAVNEDAAGKETGAADAKARLILVTDLAHAVADLAKRSSSEPPSAAEFVDLVRACIELKIDKGHPTFEQLRRLVVGKGRAARAG
jgi:MoxR-like ATPase